MFVNRDASQYAGLDVLADRFSFCLVMDLSGVGRGH